MPDQYPVYLATAVAALASYALGLLLRPNKARATKVLGFIGLVLLGPIFYTLAFTGFLGVFFGDVSLSKVPAIYAYLLFGALLSPIIIAFGIYKKPWGTTNAL